MKSNKKYFIESYSCFRWNQIAISQSLAHKPLLFPKAWRTPFISEARRLNRFWAVWYMIYFSIRNKSLMPLRIKEHPFYWWEIVKQPALNTAKRFTGYFDDKENPIFVGDMLRSEWGYDIIVVEDGNIYTGKLVCTDKDSCKNIPYSLNQGKGHVIINQKRKEQK